MSLIKLLEIGLITFIFSFGVQYLFYHWYKFTGHNLIKQHKSVVDYQSGIWGDGILIPAVNIFALSLLNRLGVFVIEPTTLLLSMILGLFITALFHIGQTKIEGINWTMPLNGHWNLLGVYHALFMFSETTLLSFVLVSYIRSSLYNLSDFWYAIAILGLFFLTFLYDYKKDLLFRSSSSRK